MYAWRRGGSAVCNNQGRRIDCRMKHYCRRKNYHLLKDWAGYNWAADSQSWGEDLQATATVYKVWVNIGRAQAKHGPPADTETLDPFQLINEESLTLCSSVGQKGALIVANQEKVAAMLKMTLNTNGELKQCLYVM